MAAGGGLPLLQRLAGLEVALALAGLGPGGLGHGRQHRGRSVGAVLVAVRGGELLDGGGDRPATGREGLDQFLVHAFQLPQAVGPVTPRDAEPAGQFRFEDPVVQGPGAGASGQQRPAVQRPPLPVNRRLSAIENQAVGVQVHVTVAGRPLVHPRDHQPGGVEHPHTLGTAAHVGGVLLHVRQPGIDRGEVRGPDFLLDTEVAGRPQQRHALGREKVQSHAATEACPPRRRISCFAIHRSYGSEISDAAASASAFAAAASSGSRNRRPR